MVSHFECIFNQRICILYLRKKKRSAKKDLIREYSAKDYGKALDKPKVVASTHVVTQVSSSDTEPKEKKTNEYDEKKRVERVRKLNRMACNTKI